VIKVQAIALNTFKEAVRDRILYAILAFAIAMIASTFVLATIGVGMGPKIIRDVGLGFISIFGTLIAIFIGIGLVHKEIDRRTIYTIISKPIHRWQFILGKYLGLVLTLFVNVAVMTVALMAIIFLGEGLWAVRLGAASAMIFLELMVITGIAVLFSAFSTPALSAIFTLSFFAIGRLLEDVRLFAQMYAGPTGRTVIEGLYYLLPNLSRFNISAEVVRGLPVREVVSGMTILYGFLYVLALLSLTAVIFQRRDFR
jgi:ABC-type transport system involved in multi-copper enzyme maturation permease subunit